MSIEDIELRLATTPFDNHVRLLIEIARAAFSFKSMAYTNCNDPEYIRRELFLSEKLKSIGMTHEQYNEYGVKYMID